MAKSIKQILDDAFNECKQAHGVVLKEVIFESLSCRNAYGSEDAVLAATHIEARAISGDTKNVQ